MLHSAATLTENRSDISREGSAYREEGSVTRPKLVTVASKLKNHD